MQDCKPVWKKSGDQYLFYKASYTKEWRLDSNYSRSFLTTMSMESTKNIPESGDYWTYWDETYYDYFSTTLGETLKLRNYEKDYEVIVTHYFLN